ncbi:MAG TPA: 8-oxo-dGTP diphosphatase MutT [Candidatus Limnocylindrales bacterium]|nr:8-oxo-dGTP diphosphatase MutT [Candidatus Limnocylindrales bacterium]
MKVIDVAAALVFRHDKLLIAQRYEKAHLGGLWEFPGGKREPGESFEQCLVRELREELDTEVEVLDLIESITHTYPEKTVHLKFFRCRWRKNEPRAVGCPAFAWVSKEELRNYSFPDADAKLLRRLEQVAELWRENQAGFGAVR